MHLVHKTSDGQKLADVGVVFWKSCHGHFLDQVNILAPTYHCCKLMLFRDLQDYFCCLTLAIMHVTVLEQSPKCHWKGCKCEHWGCELWQTSHRSLLCSLPRVPHHTPLHSECDMDYWTLPGTDNFGTDSLSNACDSSVNAFFMVRIYWDSPGTCH